VEKAWAVSDVREFYLRKPSLSRQRVRARHRPDSITTTTVETQIITRREVMGIGSWWRRWLPWFPTPLGGRL
jgi:hypothetical protein